MNRLTDKELRHCRRTGIVGRCHADHNQAARDALAYRRALRKVDALLNAPPLHYTTNTRKALSTIARALGSKK